MTTANLTTLGLFSPNILTMGPLNGLTICMSHIYTPLFVTCCLLHHADNLNNIHRPHDGWLDISKPFITAFKAGASSVASYIKSDQLVYWYRPAPRNVNCDSTDTCMVPANNASGNYFLGRPNGWESMEDSVFVVSLLTVPASVHVNSGGTVYAYDAPIGVFAQAIPMHIGIQSFSVSRNGQDILSGTSLKPIIDGCVCGLYNFNAYGEIVNFAGLGLSKRLL